MPLETRWSLGVLIGLPVLALILVACLAATIKGISVVRNGDGEGWLLVGLGVGLGLFAIVVAAFGYWPYKAEYHQWRTVQGVVQDVNKRLIAEDKSMSERYVFKIDGTPYGVDDTRASLVKPGDTVRLSCKREWQYASASGWACRWDQ